MAVAEGKKTSIIAINVLYQGRENKPLRLKTNWKA